MLRRVLLNSGVMFAGQVIVKVLGLVWLAIVARHLGDADFGHLTYALSLASLVGILVEFGFSSVITRAVARCPEEAPRYFSNVLSLRMTLSVISIPLTVLISLNTGATVATLAPVYIAAISASVAGLYATSNSVFFGREQMKFPSVIMVVSKVIAILVGLLMVRMGLGIFWIACVFLLESVLNLIISVPVLSRQLGFPFVPRVDLAFWRYLLREATPFALALILGLVYFKIDVVMLSAMKGSRHVGWYSAGYRLLEGLVYLSAAFINTVFPTFSKLKATSQDQLRTAVGGAWEFLIGFGLPMAIGLALVSDRIVWTLFGEGYVETIPVLRWIGAALIFVFINNLLGVVLGAIDRQKITFTCALIGVVINVTLNLILIPKYAHLGAARATLVTQVLLSVLFSFFVIRTTGVRLNVGRLLKLAVSGGLMAAALLVWPSIHLVGALALGAGVYSASIVLLRTIHPEEWRRIREALFARRAGDSGD